jgi:ferrochelatase
MSKVLIVNFGGPRNLDEVEAFLEELLCDPDLIRTPFPKFFQDWFFKRVARKRAVKVRHDYAEIGGKSPIYFDTEALAKSLSLRAKREVVTFHRYLRATHEMEKLQEEFLVLPLFPQFSYATTGSAARCLAQCKKLSWIKSYETHPAFILAHQKRIESFLVEKSLVPEETILLFSAHGVPKKFVDEGDPYQKMCEATVQEVMKAFPKMLGKLSYQSKFGRGEWIRPYTDEACEQMGTWGLKNCVIVPISFTSDHIETLFEIEKLYLPIIRAKGMNAYRCPALNQEPYWIDALVEILESPEFFSTQSLIRK